MNTNKINYQRTVSSMLFLTMLLSCNAWSLDRLEGRFQSVEKLLETSSAAAQIKASGNSEARAGQEEARAHYEKALQADTEGDNETADAQLLLATKAMLLAVRLADQKDVVQAKRITDFQNRESAIIALLEAHERITQDGDNAEAGKVLQRLVKKNIAEANVLLSQDSIDEGRALLDETYVVTKMAVEEIRGGETLVRSLNFASKEEEYAYELDRNKTHFMLVRVLLVEKLQQPRIEKQVQPLLEEAESLRKQAEQQAGKGGFEEAVTTLEESTHQVTRAIRMAGIYIPG